MTWTTDFDHSYEIIGSHVFVLERTQHQYTGWLYTNNSDSLTIGTDSITFHQIQGDLGNATVCYLSNDNHAVNKRYVDDLISGLTKLVNDQQETISILKQKVGI